MSLQSEPKLYPQEKAPTPLEEARVDVPPLENPQKGRWERSWPTIACGAGLFSDGYLNGVCIHCLCYYFAEHATCAVVTLSHMAHAIGGVTLTHVDIGDRPGEHYAGYHLPGCLQQLPG